MLGRRCHFCNNRVRGIRGRIWTCPLCEATNAIAEDGTDIFLPAYARPQHRFKPLRLYMEKPSYNPSRRLCETCDYRLEQYTSAYNAAPTAGERRKLQKTRPELCAACKLRLANATKPCTSTVARVWVHRLWRLASLVARLIALLMMPLLPFWPAGLTILTSLSILRAGWVRLFPHTIACLQPSPDGRFDELATIIDDMNIDETSSQPDRPRRMPMWRCLLALTPLLPLPLSLAGPAIAMAVCFSSFFFLRLAPPPRFSLHRPHRRPVRRLHPRHGRLPQNVLVRHVAAHHGLWCGHRRASHRHGLLHPAK
ncbi:hypothetical protein J8273_7457 [Carpediemonas membranifera]|uniref:Ima1 N-terminal domain-containing protein n=1 Tax=Carpediemonas membranifera TaxID=201153 RepID=A0A8J6AQL3_9EUKA|nr:hypothetical protein J8273_7457 [Carpediemonas membranifera]|eukprot:KAG9391183.1 hypothetical protein J8273_7457 [Carpediemonas membranifera]